MGVSVKAIKTIMRGQVYLPPGSVFEYPDQASADYAISRGMVTADLGGLIAATPEAEIVIDAEGKETEVAPVAASDAPPESFITDPSPVAPAAPEPAREQPRGNSRGNRR